MNNKYEGKYFSIVGDSISTLEGYIPRDYPCYYSRENQFITGIQSYRDTWWGEVISHFGGKLLVNNSWSGSTVCYDGLRIESSCACSDERTSTLGEDGILPDVILIYIGTNDRGHGYKISSDDKKDRSVIENAYRIMLEKIKKNYPESEIFCLTLPRTFCSRNPSFVFPVSQRGVLMSDYCKLIEKLAAENECSTVDLFSCDLCDTVDALHPNYNGMRIIAAEVIKEMEKKNV